MRAAGRGVRHQHSNDRISTRDGRTAQPSIRDPERCGIPVVRCLAPADIQGGRNTTRKAPNADRPRRPNRARILSSLPTKRERRSSHALAQDQSNSSLATTELFFGLLNRVIFRKRWAGGSVLKKHISPPIMIGNNGLRCKLDARGDQAIWPPSLVHRDFRRDTESLRCFIISRSRYLTVTGSALSARMVRASQRSLAFSTAA